MISKEEVLRIAKLARLELTDKEVEKMQKDLSEILDYFDLLKKAPKVKLEKLEIKNKSLREDKIISSHDLASDLVVSAPDKQDGYIKVKAIL